MSDVTNLRQSKNKGEVTGILAEKDIHAGKNTANGKEMLEGFVSIKVDEINQVRIKVSADVTKKDGTPNPAYDNLKGFNENAVSIADGGIENASRVTTSSVQLNPYHSTQSGRDVITYRTGFISKYNGGDDNWEPKAEVSVELYVKAIVPEMNKDGEETGRAVLKGVMFNYNGGAELVDLIIPAEDNFAEQALDGAVEIGQTYEFFADIVNNRVEIKKEIPTVLGKPRIETSYDYKNELVMTGCSEPVPENLAYDSNAVKLALVEREERIKNNRASGNASAPAQNKPSAASKGRMANW